MDAGFVEGFNSGRRVSQPKDYSVPSTGLLVTAISDGREPDDPGPMRRIVRSASPFGWARSWDAVDESFLVSFI